MMFTNNGENMKKVILTSEQVMNARDAKEAFNYPKAAFVVAAAVGDTMSMRILSHMQDVMDINKGKLPDEFNEILRIVVLTLKTKVERPQLADWVLDYYR